MLTGERLAEIRAANDGGEYVDGEVISSLLGHIEEQKGILARAKDTLTKVLHIYPCYPYHCDNCHLGRKCEGRTLVDDLHKHLKRC